MRVALSATALALAATAGIVAGSSNSACAGTSVVSVDTAKVTYVAKMTKRLAWVYVQAGPVTKRYELYRCRNDRAWENCWADMSGDRFDAHGALAYAFIGGRVYSLPR